MEDQYFALRVRKKNHHELASLARQGRRGKDRHASSLIFSLYRPRIVSDFTGEFYSWCRPRGVEARHGFARCCHSRHGLPNGATRQRISVVGLV
jgi:hypothetical protein